MSVLLRQDPPFDMHYITTTHMLERIHPKTLVVNDPFHVRNAPEKLFVMDYSQTSCLPTLITRQLADVKAFRAEYNDIIIKPLYTAMAVLACFASPKAIPILERWWRCLTRCFREPFIVQQYLADVRAGRQAYHSC